MLIKRLYWNVSCDRRNWRLNRWNAHVICMPGDACVCARVPWSASQEGEKKPSKALLDCHFFPISIFPFTHFIFFLPYLADVFPLIASSKWWGWMCAPHFIWLIFYFIFNPCRDLLVTLGNRLHRLLEKTSNIHRMRWAWQVLCVCWPCRLSVCAHGPGDRNANTAITRRSPCWECPQSHYTQHSPTVLTVFSVFGGSAP